MSLLQAALCAGQLRRPPPPPPPAETAYSPPTLRDYQEEFVAKVRQEMRSAQAVLLVAATGAGKTVVFSYISRQASFKGKRVLILAHRDQLIKQASRKLTDNGVQHGIIMAGFTPHPRRLVQVASVQTLVRRVDKLKESFTPDLIVIDEAHLSAAASYKKILEAWPDAKVLGVTGSPIRLDGKGLGRHAGGCFDVMVQGISIKQLIDQGYLVRPVYYGSRETIDLTGIKKVGGDYDSEALAAVMDKPKITGSAIEQYRKHADGIPAVAWCTNVAHARHVAEEFNANGIPALALSGEDDSAARDKALAQLANGTLKVITFAMLLVEGLDRPEIGAVILLRPTMSLSSYLQVIGRGLRTIYADGMPLGTIDERFAAIDAGPKGRSCIVLDHCDLWKRHGFAHHEREWSLDGMVRKKGKKKQPQEDAGPQLIQCKGCYFIFEATPGADQHVCPQCGRIHEKKVRKVEHVDGDLAEITEEMAMQQRKQRQREVSSARTIEELEALGAARGYSPYWAKMVFDARKKK